jgi:branched-chain amino acid transport system permease protein
MLLFTVSSAIGIIGGILYILVRGYIGPSSFSLTVSLTPLLGSVIGTVSASIAGAVLGTYVLVVLLEGLRIVAIYKIIAYAVIIVIAVLVKPRGLFHYMVQFYHFFRRVYE